MNKKGFTLIELLVVIVILAIIALITVPNALSMIETAQTRANERAGESGLRAAEIYCLEARTASPTAEVPASVTTADLVSTGLLKANSALPDGYTFSDSCVATVSVDTVVSVTLESITANGTSGVQDTTQLVLTLSQDIDLVASDVTLTGATKGTLTDNNNGTYTLAISNITVGNGGTVTVQLSKDGYSIDQSSNTVQVNVAEHQGGGGA
jgi:type IV pilus assembly protein PilA